MGTAIQKWITCPSRRPRMISNVPATGALLEASRVAPSSAAGETWNDWGGFAGKSLLFFPSFAGVSTRCGGWVEIHRPPPSLCFGFGGCGVVFPVFRVLRSLFPAGFMLCGGWGGRSRTSCSSAARRGPTRRLAWSTASASTRLPVRSSRELTDALPSRRSCAAQHVDSACGSTTGRSGERLGA